MALIAETPRKYFEAAGREASGGDPLLVCEERIAVQIIWMRVSEVRPVRDIEVLVYDAGIRQVTTGHFDGNSWRSYDYDAYIDKGQAPPTDMEITHWAFLPRPPTDH